MFVLSEDTARIIRVCLIDPAVGNWRRLKPCDSPLRFVFDGLMGLRLLREEEAAENPLFKRAQVEKWLKAARLKTRIGYSSYQPPNLFYLLRDMAGRPLLRARDAVRSRISRVRSLVGTITADAVRT